MVLKLMVRNGLSEKSQSWMVLSDPALAIQSGSTAREVNMSACATFAIGWRLFDPLEGLGNFESLTLLSKETLTRCWLSESHCTA
tara:strand:- start:1194 stop:1448 length:255 start_codon:yes stop_codon:yes gene_type:complete